MNVSKILLLLFQIKAGYPILPSGERYMRTELTSRLMWTESGRFMVTEAQFRKIQQAKKNGG